jgi:hypothetical protein
MGNLNKVENFMIHTTEASRAIPMRPKICLN